MTDKCPKCGVKMWHYFHWIEYALRLTKEKPPCDDGHKMHQINGPSCLQRQLEQARKEIDALDEAQKCASCGSTICPPMQCGRCIEQCEPVKGMPARPVTTELKEELEQAKVQIAKLQRKIDRDASGKGPFTLHDEYMD